MGNLGIANSSPKLNLDIGNTNANHKIGRAILTAGNIHNADKLDFLSIGRWDGSSTADWQFSGIKYGVITAAAAGESSNNHTCMTFHTWGNNIWSSKEVMRLTSRGRLGINTTSPTELLDVNGNIYSSGIIELGTTVAISGTKVDCRGTIACHSIMITDINSITANSSSVNSNYQLTLSPPTSIAAAKIETIRQGVDYNQKLVLQPTQGQVGIGTMDPINILQVGDGGRLKISNGASDSSAIGTRDYFDSNNTRIFLFGNTNATPGIIEYITTSTGVHKFITNGINERMRIDNNGNIGIGTNANLTSNLTVQGRTLFNDIASFSNSI
jgi:hypothetical protein